MSELETMIRDSAGAGDWSADWEDVLRRSGHSRRPSKRTAGIAAVVAVAVVLLLPGIGIGGGVTGLISHSSPPGLKFSTQLLRDNRLIGTVSVRTSRLFVAIDPKTGRIKSFRPTHPEGASGPEFRWSLDLTGAATVSSVRIVDRRSGRNVVRLCSPCKDGAHGVFRRSRATFAAVFGRGTVVAETSRGEVTAPLGLGPIR